MSLTLAAGQLAALDDMGAALAATRSELVRAAVDEFLARYGAAAVSGGEGATT